MAVLTSVLRITGYEGGGDNSGQKYYARSHDGNDLFRVEQNGSHRFRIALILPEPLVFGFVQQVSLGQQKILRMLMIVFGRPLRLSGCEAAQQVTVQLLTPKGDVS